MLERIGLDFEILDSGCCGMAGAFGYEAAKYQVSVDCGERVLLPAVRAAAPDTLIIANGFSCQQQIEQLTGRRSLHIAQVLQMALRDCPGGTVVRPAENALRKPAIPKPKLRHSIAVLAGMAVIAIGTAAAGRRFARRG